MLFWKHECLRIVKRLTLLCVQWTHAKVHNADLSPAINLRKTAFLPSTKGGRCVVGDTVF